MVPGWIIRCKNSCCKYGYMYKQCVLLGRSKICGSEAMVEPVLKGFFSLTIFIKYVAHNTCNNYVCHVRSNCKGVHVGSIYAAYIIDVLKSHCLCECIEQQTRPCGAVSENIGQHFYLWTRSIKKLARTVLSLLANYTLCLILLFSWRIIMECEYRVKRRLSAKATGWHIRQ